MNELRRTLLVLLLIVYTGQGLAAFAGPCQMMSLPGESTHHHEGQLDHAGHDMSGMDEDMAANCCDGGVCSMSHCQMAPALPSLNYSDATEVAFQPGTAIFIRVPDSPLETHFRPPAIA